MTKETTYTMEAQDTDRLYDLINDLTGSDIPLSLEGDNVICLADCKIVFDKEAEKILFKFTKKDS